MIKKIKKCMALLPLLLLLGCPSANPLDIMESSFPPVAVTDTTEFLSSTTNDKIYAFDTATDEIIGVYAFFDDVHNLVRLPKSPYLYYSKGYEGDINRLEIATGKSKKLSTDYTLCGAYSPTEILIYRGGFSSSVFAIIDDKTGKITELEDYQLGFTLEDGEKYIPLEGKIQRVSDKKEFLIGEDSVSTISKNSKYEARSPDIGANVITIEYYCYDENYEYDYKVAVFTYTAPTADIELTDSNYIGDFNRDNHAFYHVGNNLYITENQTVHKYDATTKQSVGKLEFTGGEFVSGVDLQYSMIIGTTLYAPLGLFEKTRQDMIVKVDLTNLTSKVIGYRSGKGE